MIRLSSPPLTTLLLCAIVAIGGVTAAIAQDALVRTPLQKQEFPGDVHATHIIQVVVAPGGVVARHSHPGIEMGYMVEGTATLLVEGKPEQAMKAGDSYSVPPGTIHSAKNTGTTPVKIIATFVVEKAKPLATPAP